MGFCGVFLKMRFSGNLSMWRRRKPKLILGKWKVAKNDFRKMESSRMLHLTCRKSRPSLPGNGFCSSNQTFFRGETHHCKVSTIETMHEPGSKILRQVDNDPGAAMGQKTKRQISPLGGRHRRVKERSRQPEFRQMKTAGFHQ